MTDAQRQRGLGPLQGLALALLVAAQHQSLVGRIQVQPNDVPEFILEAGVVGDFEGPRQMRPDVVATADP